jgi:hypothetical protein
MINQSKKVHNWLTAVSAAAVKMGGNNQLMIEVNKQLHNRLKREGNSKTPTSI